MAKKTKKRSEKPEEAEAAQEAVLEEAVEESAPSQEEMPDAAQELAELESQREALEEERRQWEMEKRSLKVAAFLREQGISEVFAPYFACVEEEMLEQAAEEFHAAFRQAVKEAVAQRLRGAGAPREPAKAQGYSREELRNLSAREINAHWDEVVRALRD